MSKYKFYISLLLLLTFTFTTQVLASLTFTTNTITGDTSSTIDLGSGNNLYLQTSGGRVGIGTNVPVRKLHVSDGGEVPNSVLVPGGVVAVLNGVTGTQSGSLEGIAASSTIAHMPGLYLRSIRARGTLSTPLPVQAEDLLSLWESEGFDGTGRVPVANIGTFVESFDGAGSGSKASGYINFLTAPLAGSAGPVERMRISSTGNVGIGTLTPGATLDVQGSVNLEKGTGSVSTNAVTVSKTSGVITDSTDVNTDTTRAAITLTNTRIATTSVVVASICSTPDAGARLGVAVTPGSGSAIATVYNSGTANQTSDYKICFIVTN